MLDYIFNSVSSNTFVDFIYIASALYHTGILALSIIQNGHVRVIYKR